MPKVIKKFIKLESLAGILLILAVILANIVENSYLHVYYDKLLGSKLSIYIDNFSISKPLVLWINDGLMALFFLLVGLELKREFLVGHLKKRENIILPLLAAIGGMFVPALIFTSINFGTDNMNGWAISSATDIAFTLGILAMLGSRVPTSLKIFLTALAIFDDIGAILIIALFYTESISLLALAFSLSCIAALFLLNKFHVKNMIAYFLIGIVLWVSLLKSGVHATLAGFLFAFFIPYSNNTKDNQLLRLEHSLHPWVAFAVIPVFAFANSGINFSEINLNFLLNELTIGIVLALVLGNTIGISGMVLLAKTCFKIPLPKSCNLTMIYGAAALAGIGFTMSLFIASLSFSDPDQLIMSRLGIIVGSLISAVLGVCLILLGSKRG